MKLECVQSALQLECPLGYYVKRFHGFGSWWTGQNTDISAIYWT